MWVVVHRDRGITTLRLRDRKKTQISVAYPTGGITPKVVEGLAFLLELVRGECLYPSLPKSRRKLVVPACPGHAKKATPAPDPYIDPKTGLCMVCAKFRKPGTKSPHNTRRSCAVCASGGTRRHQHWLPEVGDHGLSWGRHPHFVKP